MRLTCLIFLILSACESKSDPSPFKTLLYYQGEYEYINNSTLILAASELDTTLYAIIDDAKYPLKKIGIDSFLNGQKELVTFQRNESEKIESYQVERMLFKLLNTEINKVSMYPRKTLFDNPASYEYQTPEKLEDNIEVGSIDDAFSKSDLLREMIIKTIDGTYRDVHSILIYKEGQLVMEEYFYGYNKDKPHQLRSAAKPFIGTLLGIAIDQGFIDSEEEKLLTYFDEEYDEFQHMDDRKRNISIKNFLMYRHGMDCENNNPQSAGNELRMRQSEDWVKHTLDLPMKNEPGGSSSYCTGCALTLSKLIELETKQSLQDFASDHLFKPMEITNYSWAFDLDPSTFSRFSQRSLTSRDLLKLAIMYLKNGKWNGRQIISTDWVKKTFDMEKGDYGYLWEHKYFMIDGKQYNSYLASGNGGQKINIWPELDMITIFTGGNYNSYQLYGKSTPPNEMIPKYILEALKKKPAP